jgi:Tfp pilus assembly protein PilN
MIRINLLPQAERKSRGRGLALSKERVIPLASLAVVIAASVATALIQGARVTSLEQDVAAAKAESEKYKKSIALINEMVQKENELNRRLDLLTALDQGRFKTVRVLDEMARRVPRYMWLTSMKEVATDRVSIEGVAFSNLVVSDLMSSLENSGIFHDVELSIVRRKEVEGQKVVGFTVTTSINSARASES